MGVLRRATRAFPAAACWLAMACGEPPTKEINQAEGALEAARAAGADEYAVDEFRAAALSLTQAQEAVEQRDYRLALGHALDAQEHAQSAAKEAAVQRANIRSEVERTLRAIGSALEQANTRLKAAQAARVPAPQLREPRQSLDDARKAVQEASTAVNKEDYLAARSLTDGVFDHVRRAIAQIDSTLASQPARRRR